MRYVKPVMSEEERDAAVTTLRAVKDGRLLVEHDEALIAHALDSLAVAPAIDPYENHQPGARKGDPGTSKEGVVAVAPRARSQRARILNAFYTRGAEGYTSWEVAQRLALRGCYWKRVSELEKEGWLSVTEEKRMSGDSKSPQRVYVITYLGQKWAERQREHVGV